MATEGWLNKGVLKALMKVYAYCDMYEEACDLYECIRLDGLQPVGIMCGCLIMCTAECGQTDLSWQIAEIAPALVFQNYTSFIHAACRNKDVDRALKMVERLRASKSFNSWK